MREAIRTGWLSLLLSFAVACNVAPNEGLLVNLQTDLVAGVEFDRAEVSVDGDETRTFAVTSHDVFSRPRWLTTYGALPRGHRSVTARLLLGTHAVVTRTIEFDFSGSYLATIILFRTCADVTCPAGASCLGGRCVPGECITGDEPSCPPPTCTTDAMCPRMIACADPECVAGACFQHANDSLCGARELCHPGTGCVPRPEDPDASSDRDAGRDASLAFDARGLDASSPDAWSPLLDAWAPPLPDAWTSMRDAPLADAGCPPGWSRCAGICTDLRNDADNCNACGNVCPGAPNATTSCRSRRCGFVCDSGFADCNGGSDGCEVPLGTNSDCSGCADACGNANGSFNHCGGGIFPACVGLACFAGYANCDGLNANGCETDVTTVNDCGSCGNDCNALPGVRAASCTPMGLCAISACDLGYANCDTDATNGCEVNTDTSAINCGRCGRSCGGPWEHARSTCSGGSCSLPTCDLGYTACDGDPRNGCTLSCPCSGC